MVRPYLNPGNGGSMFLRNLDIQTKDYTAKQPEDHHCLEIVNLIAAIFHELHINVGN
jgi:hypothetical protein